MSLFGHLSIWALIFRKSYVLDTALHRRNRNITLLEMSYFLYIYNVCVCVCVGTANKYYSSASLHEQKNKKTTGQIKFSAVTIN